MVCAYRKRKRGLSDPVILRALCVAMTFVSEARDGDVMLARNFDDMMYGRMAERLEYEGVPVVYDEEASAETRLVWDAICLLIEEYEPEREVPQLVFDVAGDHSSLAYDVISKEAEEEEPAVVAAKAVVAATAVVKPAVVVPVVKPAATVDPMELLAEMERELAETKRQLAEKDRQIAELNGELKSLKKQVDWHQNRDTQMLTMLVGRLSVPTTTISGPVHNNGGTVTGDVNGI